MKKLLYSLLLLLISAGCSTTKHLPQGERLYIGQKKPIIENPTPTATGEAALTEINSALKKAPNNSLLGSSFYRIPFPLGLWIYSGFKHYEKGFGKWFFDRFAANPVLLTGVNPRIRQRIATNILHDYGYFDGKVSYATFPQTKDSLKVKLQYTLRMGTHYYIDTIFYRGFNANVLQLMEMGRRRSPIHAGSQFNVVALNDERSRISTLLRNMGYYYFRPDYLTYQADTTQAPHCVSLRMTPVAGLPDAAQRQFYTGKTRFYLIDDQHVTDNREPQQLDSITYRGMELFYSGKLKVRPAMLYRWMNYQGYRRKREELTSGNLRRRPEKLYSEYRQSRIRERLSNVGIFSYLEMDYQPRDSALVSDTLDVVLRAVLDKPYDAELDFNMKVKSNNQMGPGASFTVTRNNVFGGGESWNVKVYGSYEWQTGRNANSALNSYEVGASTALTFPRVLFPRMGGREYDFPATTTFKLYIDHLNRAKYYQMQAFGGNVTYDFQPVATVKHSFTPLRLTFNVLRHPTDAFLEIQQENPALYVSLRDQFIPAVEYTYTYDNGKLRQVRHPSWWQTTVTAAGNVTSVIYRLAGHPFERQEKKLFGVPFAQFLKVNSEYRYKRKFDRNNLLAGRVAAGVVWSYGNTLVAPYTEMFYVGGANSVRAFASRSIGPGGTVPEDTKYAFIDQVGDIRFEANLEYRFRILGDLHGATFLDAGNVWLLRDDANRPQAHFVLKDFARQLALGTGVGIRYDMDFLVFRLDLGVALHAPYDTGKSGYYNIPRFRDGLALHFAIGYPF
ncbi:MAG: BamA/TamA family outer membrane protein [Mediterranea sp.]|jgi:outer membrane protein assembly factor BamA|nr:BamA/TamA family outer membrane protein [Mediterranea sp.]